MKRSSILILIIGVVFIIAGIGIYVFAYGNVASPFGSRVMNQDPVDKGINAEGTYYYRNHMMTGPCYDDAYNGNGQKLSLDELTDEVEGYIKRYDENLAISDIFIYEDTDYYFSIMEKDSGRGAMELLVNPYTNEVYPEFGPNMMWNLKYGKHRGGSMMGGRTFGRGHGMMGFYDDDYSYKNNNYIVENAITSKEAYNEGVEYLERNSNELTLGEEFHEFYGYYTFHVESDGETVGMLSVNGFIGDVWYHDWHGKLIEIVEGHGEVD